MNLRVVTPLLLVCIITLQGQSPAPPTVPAGVAVLKFSWHDLSYRAAWDEPRNSASNQGMEDTPVATRDPDSIKIPLPNGTVAPRIRERMGETKQPRSSDAQLPSDVRPAKGRDLPRYLYEVRVKNIGEGTIEAVEWDYVFVDAVQRTVLARHRFQTFRRFGPGKSLTISGVSLAPPTRVITSRESNNKTEALEERVVIRCVAYSDGTVRWFASGSEKDCDAIRGHVATAAVTRDSKAPK